MYYNTGMGVLYTLAGLLLIIVVYNTILLYRISRLLIDRKIIDPVITPAIPIVPSNTSNSSVVYLNDQHEDAVHIRARRQEDPDEW